MNFGLAFHILRIFSKVKQQHLNGFRFHLTKAWTKQFRTVNWPLSPAFQKMQQIKSIFVSGSPAHHEDYVQSVNWENKFAIIWFTPKWSNKILKRLYLYLFCEIYLLILVGKRFRKLSRVVNLPWKAESHWSNWNRF